MDKQKPGTDPQDRICELLSTKSVMKQDVHGRTVQAFSQLKELLEVVAHELAEGMPHKDERVEVRYTDKGEMAAELKVAGDILIFHMHTNVFRLDQGHSLWKTSYLEDDELRGFFGVINIYNFLSDSFKYNRERDLGYLVARIFLNKEGHFFVQGKRQLGFLYNDLPRNQLDATALKQVLYSVVLYVLDFDLLAPPYDQVNQVTVMEMNELNANLKLSTGKRLGFRFHADTEDIA